MAREKIYFVTGIDTDVGKSYATGWLSALWMSCRTNVITQKLVQTGCAPGSISEDIAIHRRLMGTGLLPEDLDHTTCPLRFEYPASPALAARMERRDVDLALADRSTRWLSERYDTVLIEGAGGLMVPIEGFYTMADYAAERALPVILVTTPRLGSVNHTLLSLDVCRTRELKVAMVIYNLQGETSPEITADTKRTIKEYLNKYHNNCELIEMPLIIF